MKQLLAVVMVLGCFVVVGCSSPDRQEGVSYELQPVFSEMTGAIKGGYTDSDTTGVVGMIHQSNYGVSSCSGSLIAPNVVLTAQHCIAPIQGYQQGVDCGSSEFGNVYSANSLYVTPATYMGYNAYDYTVASKVLVPGGGYGAQWGNDSMVCGNDVALVILAEPVPASKAKVMIPRVDIPVAKGELYSAVGYGATNQAGEGSGTRRRRDNLNAECTGDNCPYYYQYSVKTAEWVGDTGVCQGDSGGPAVDSIDRVIGVASRGGNNCSSPVYGYVYEWRDWIKEQTVLATKQAGIPTPKWAEGYPTDPKFAFEVAGECEVGTDCLSGLCEGGVCSRSCSEAAPCPAGFACMGDPDVCKPIPVGDTCESNEDCPYGPCDLGVCTRPCTNAWLDCPEGYTCEDGLCRLFPVGYPCEVADDCYSGLCGEDGYCTRLCGESAPCPDSYYCHPDKAECVLMPVGFDCETAADCWSGICAENGLCTRPCSDEVLCPAGYDCNEGVCSLLPVGYPCETADDCFSGLCGDQGFCTRLCSEEAPCENEFVCSVDGLCVEPSVGAQACEEGSDCPAGWCMNNYCTRECDENYPCPDGMACLEEVGLCEAPQEVLEQEGVLGELEDIGIITNFADDGEDLGGCSSTSTPSTLPWLFLLLFTSLVTLSGRRTRLAEVPAQRKTSPRA